MPARTSRVESAIPSVQFIAIEQFANFAVHLADLGCDSICVKDMAGLITPQNAYDLIRAIKKEINLPGKSSHSLHKRHGPDELLPCLSGRRGYSRYCHVASFWRNSQPSTESAVAALEGTPYDTGLDLELLTEIKRYFEKIMEIYAPVFNPISARVDTNVLAIRFQEECCPTWSPN